MSEKLIIGIIEKYKLQMGINGYDCGPCSIKNFIVTCKHNCKNCIGLEQLLDVCQSTPVEGTSNIKVIDAINSF